MVGASGSENFFRFVATTSGVTNGTTRCSGLSFDDVMSNVGDCEPSIAKISLGTGLMEAPSSSKEELCVGALTADIFLFVDGSLGSGVETMFEVDRTAGAAIVVGGLISMLRESKDEDCSSIESSFATALCFSFSGD